MDATAITEATFEKIVLILDPTLGITAPAATATKPAINAYSIRSASVLDRLQFQKKIFHAVSVFFP